MVIGDLAKSKRAHLKDLANFPIARRLAGLFISLPFDGPPFLYAKKQPLRGTTGKPRQSVPILLPGEWSLVALAGEARLSRTRQVRK